jgi:two-component system, NarL family, sensor histidine kinase UhpB
VVRNIAGELRPSVLDDLGLLSALEWQLTELQKRTGLTYELNTNVPQVDLSNERATAVFRLFQEALTNITRHAQATRVQVSLGLVEDRLEVEIIDNGVGIPPEAVNSATAWGLIGMRERAALLGGTVDFSGTPGQGTTVKICMPVG